MAFEYVAKYFNNTFISRIRYKIIKIFNDLNAKSISTCMTCINDRNKMKKKLKFQLYYLIF